MKEISMLHFSALACVAVMVTASACSSEADCSETRTCANSFYPEGGAGGDDARAPQTGGAPEQPNTTGGTASGGVTSTGGTDGGAPSGIMVGATCADEGKRLCAGPASDTVLECTNGALRVQARCSRGLLCDSNAPGCVPIATGCERLGPGDSFCEGDQLNTCGPDLVTLTVASCESGCSNGKCVGSDCGDGEVQDDEECDDGNDDDSDECLSSCVEARCGDGVVFEGEEECDDGNDDDSDDCVSGCFDARCGDGFTRDGKEECDDGNKNEDDECLVSCELTGCGDGVLSGDEECDDGNEDPGDDCTTSCKEATCGDSYVWNDHEACDDANSTAGDGCSTECQVEPIVVAVGGDHSCAVLGDSRLKCWGDNSYGQVANSTELAIGDDTSELGSGLKTRLTDVTLVALGDRHTCALQGDSVRCWGDNRAKQLGPRATTDVSRLEVLMEPWVDVERPAQINSLCAGNTWSAALLEDGSVTTWGVSDMNLEGTLMNVPFSSEVAAIECAGNTLCARLEDKIEVECWSAWYSAAPGLRTIDPGLDKVPADISVGSVRGCILTSTGLVRCWGLGADGALMTDPAYVWLFPGPQDVWPESSVGEGAQRLSGGANVTCVTYQDGGVRCWGVGETGVLGQPELTSGGNNLGDDAEELGDGIPPINFGSGLKVRMLSTSGKHACALFENGRVKCWGDNSRGQLAIGSTSGNDAAIGDDTGEMGDVLRYALID